MDDHESHDYNIYEIFPFLKDMGGDISAAGEDLARQLSFENEKIKAIIREKSLLFQNRLYKFTYKPDGNYSVSFNIILATSADEAKEKAMEYLQHLQEEKLKSGKLYYSESWRDLNDIFLDVELLPVDGDVLHVGEYIE